MNAENTSLALQAAQANGYSPCTKHKNMYRKGLLYIAIEKGKVWVGRPFFQKSFTDLGQFGKLEDKVNTLVNGSKVYNA
jgi:hypothetical protein